jgi:hypothetical protein
LASIVHQQQLANTPGQSASANSRGQHTGSLSLLEGHIILIEVLLLLLGSLQRLGLAAWEANELVDCIVSRTDGRRRTFSACTTHFVGRLERRNR